MCSLRIVSTLQHPGQPKYTRAYHHASAMLGVDAFALFSVICYLALQTRNPGQEFCKLSARLRTLQGSDHQQFSQILDDPSVAMVATSAKGTDDRFVPFVIANPGRWPHPILDPYIQLIKQLSVLSDGASAWLEDFFARPHRYLREHDLPGQCLEVLFGTARGQNTSTFVFINDYTRFVLAAPIRIHVNPAEARTMRGTVTFGNPVTVVPMGIAVSDREYAQFTLDMTAAFGMLQTLSAPESADCAFYCPQQDCPVYRSRICRMYYKFPIQAGQYRDCAFPQLLYELHLNLDTILGIIENQRVPTQRRGYDNTYPYLTKAIELKPGDAEAYYLRGVVKRAKGDLDGANADYSKVIELKPDYAEAYYNRGDVKQAKGDLDGAVADYSKAIELKPDYAEAYVNRGVAKGAKGDLDGAIADLTKAIELKADYAEAYINRGVAKYTKDDLDGAIADFSKAIELKPDYAEAYYYRGHAKQAKGDMDGAIADLTKASELKPGVFQ